MDQVVGLLMGVIKAILPSVTLFHSVSLGLYKKIRQRTVFWKKKFYYEIIPIQHNYPWQGKTDLGMHSLGIQFYQHKNQQTMQCK